MGQKDLGFFLFLLWGFVLRLFSGIRLGFQCQHIFLNKFLIFPLLKTSRIGPLFAPSIVVNFAVALQLLLMLRMVNEINQTIRILIHLIQLREPWLYISSLAAIYLSVLASSIIRLQVRVPLVAVANTRLPLDQGLKR